MTTSAYEVLEELRTQATSEADKGSRFERLMEQFLRTAPVYADQFRDVYLWSDWPWTRPVAAERSPRLY